jgi:hypothetical protein
LALFKTFLSKESMMKEIAGISLKKQEAMESLPDVLLPIYEQLIEDYRFSCITRYGRSFVSYVILADLIKLGWRPSADPIDDK